MSVLQALYDSEINFSISTFWDGGFHVGFGDMLNGFKTEKTCETFAEAEAWLSEETKRFYPDSEFVREASL